MINLSFIIPVYNQEKHIQEFLEELCKAEIPDYEIICVDDGSTDKTAELLDKAAEKEEKIKVYHLEDRGPGYARNYGMEKSAGRYLAFCDSDDRVHVDVYKTMYEVICQEDKDLVVANYQEVFDSGKIVPRRFELSGEKDYWGLLQQIAVYGKIFRREFLEKNKINYPEAYQGEDRVFLGKVVVAHPDFIWLDEISYDYMRHESVEGATLTHSYSFHFFSQRIGCWKEFYYICKKEYPGKAEDYILRGMSYLYEQWVKLPQEKKENALALVQELLGLLENIEQKNKRVFGLPLEKFLKVQTYQEYAKAVVSENVKGEVRSHNDLEKPGVTIIIPMYNVGKYLRKCLYSLVSQTYEAFEIICVDDGSDDETIEIVEEYRTFDKRIRLLQQKHGRAGVARNLGMTKARGDYYLFLDGDDFFEAEMLEKSMKKIQEDDADICLFDAQLFFEETETVQKPDTYLKRKLVPQQIPFEGKSYPYIFNVSTASPWNKLIKKSLVDQYEIQFMPTQRCNDVYFIFLTMAVAKRITVLPEVFVNYRQSAGSLQANNDKSPWDWYTALVTLREKLKQLGIYEDVEQSFMNYVLSLSIYNLSSLKTASVFMEFYHRAKAEIFENLGLLTYDAANYYPYNEERYAKLQRIMNSSVEEYLFVENRGLKEERNKWAEKAKKAQRERKKVKESITFRTGEAVLYVPRKIRGIWKG